MPARLVGTWQGRLHLAVLVAFAVTQPLLGLLAGYAEFFAARRAGAIDVLLLVGVLALALPALAVLLAEAARRAGDRAGVAMHLLLVAGLSFLALLPMAERLGATGVLSGPLAAGLASALLTGLYIRTTAARQFLTLLAPALLAFPALFLFDAEIRVVLSPESESELPAAPAAREAPVVLLIFDELSAATLMNEHGALDDTLFPGFSRLARQSTWYRNASTVSDATVSAVPALLSGSYVEDEDRQPVLREYPVNLFTLLADGRPMNVHESASSLCPRDVCRQPRHPLTIRVRQLLADTAVVYLHLIAPTRLEARLPSISQGWGNFLGGGSAPSGRELEGGWLAYAESQLEEDRWAVFRRFAQAIPRAPSSLNVLHLLFPHLPYEYLPSGHRYPRIAVEGLVKERWSGDAWAVDQAWQRYLFQAVCADSMVGELLDALDRKGLMDRALLIVTADHGVSFRIRDDRRPISETNYPDILSIPLFVKRPGQTRGVVSDRNVEIIDVLPSITAELGIELPSYVDGESLFATDQPAREMKRLWTYRGGALHEFPGDETTLHGSAHERRLLFGTSEDPADLFAMGPFRDLVGRPVESLRAGDVRSRRVELIEPRSLGDLRGSRRLAVSGELRLAHAVAGPVDLAVAVDGVVRTVTRSFAGDGTDRRFVFFLPHDAEGAIELFSVQRDADGGARLSSVSSRPDLARR